MSDFDEQTYRDQGYNENTIQEAKRLYDKDIEETERFEKSQMVADETWQGNPLNAWRKMNESNNPDRIMEQILLPEQLEAERAVQAAKLAPPKPESVVEYDELGRLKAPKKTPSTTREQVEYMRAIRKQYGQA